MPPAAPGHRAGGQPHKPEPTRAASNSNSNDDEAEAVAEALVGQPYHRKEQVRGCQASIRAWGVAQWAWRPA